MESLKKSIRIVSCPALGWDWICFIPVIEMNALWNPGNSYLIPFFLNWIGELANGAVLPEEFSPAFSAGKWFQLLPVSPNSVYPTLWCQNPAGFFWAGFNFVFLPYWSINLCVANPILWSLNRIKAALYVSQDLDPRLIWILWIIPHSVLDTIG